MPEILDTDPGKGFVAFPMSVFDLDLTPGAFRTLAELCRMANTDGKCWPSLAQLGDRLGRSRAAVSGYIAELREAGLIETETQKMANGYNYRLRYRVVFWKEWRAQLGQRHERRVQQDVRPLKTQNQNHKNQSPRRCADQDLIEIWQNCVGRAPYPGFDIWPSDAMLEKSRGAAKTRPAISADIGPRYLSFLQQKGVEISSLPADIQSLTQDIGSDPSQTEAFFAALEAQWKRHWIKPPTLPQLKRLLRDLPPPSNPRAKAKLLASFLKRWETYTKSLPRTGTPGRVAA